jgi:hypothetical protein
MALVELITKEVLPKVFDLAPRLFRWLTGLPHRLRYVPLQDAARRVYEESRRSGALVSGAAERMSIDKSSDGILNYVATYLAQDTSIWGKRPPSRRLEQIGAVQTSRGSFASGGTALIMRDKSAFTELCISRVDLHSALKAIREEAAEEAKRRSS